MADDMSAMPGYGLMMEMQMARLSPNTRARVETTTQQRRRRSRPGSSSSSAKAAGAADVPLFAPPTQPEWAEHLDANSSSAQAGGDGGGGELTIARAWLVEHAKLLTSKAKLEQRVAELKQTTADTDGLMAEIRTLTNRVIALEAANMELRIRAQRVDDAEAAAAAAEAERAELAARASDLGRQLALLSDRNATVVATFKAVLAREKDGLAALDAVTRDLDQVREAHAIADARASRLTGELAAARLEVERIAPLEADLAATTAELEATAAARDRGAARFAALRKDHDALAEREAALRAAHDELTAEAGQTAADLRALRHSLWSRDVEYRELKRALKAARADVAAEKKAAAAAAKKHKAAFRDAAQYAAEEEAATKTMLADARAKLLVAASNNETLLALLVPLADAALDLVNTHTGLPPDLADITRSTAASLAAYRARLADPDGMYFSDHDDYDDAPATAPPTAAAAAPRTPRRAPLLPVNASPIFVPSNVANPKVRKRNFLIDTDKPVTWT